jgi:antitoxin VapB
VNEIDEKTQRLTAICRHAGAGGIIINAQPNFSWITGGRTNRIDGSREAGAGSVFVAADGRRFILANAIEMPRLRGEELADFGAEALEYPWTDDHALPDAQVRRAREAIGGDAAIGADSPVGGAISLEREVIRARAPLTAAEVDRYRDLGRDAGRALGDLCRTLRPGVEEIEIARLAADAIARAGARAVVTLVAADERLARFRHPIATRRRWERVVMVVVCAQRGGLIVSLSRIVSAGAVDPELASRTRATAGVFARMLDATRPEAAAAEVFAAAARAYADAGFPGEERLHHQGGATGYRTRDWVAHPASQERVRAPQAFAWNPSITGTKIEETALVSAAGVELITSTSGWPSIPVEVQGQTLQAPDVLALS